MPSTRVPELCQAAGNYLTRRNEFWSTYGQFSLSLIVIVFITVLLLADVISAEAGLPILAGIGSFAIGRGVSMTSVRGTPSRPPQD